MPDDEPDVVVPPVPELPDLGGPFGLAGTTTDDPDQPVNLRLATAWVLTATLALRELVGQVIAYAEATHAQQTQAATEQAQQQQAALAGAVGALEGVYATTSALATEIAARQAADTGLQGQISTLVSRLAAAGIA